MSNAGICPVVDAFIRTTQESVKRGPAADFSDAEENLASLREYAKTLPLDYEVQRMRAFHCLHSLVLEIRVRSSAVVDASVSMPLNREGITGLVETCVASRNQLEADIYARELLDDSADPRWIKNENTKQLIKVVNYAIEAAEYLRPRLRNGGPLGMMGHYYAAGLDTLWCESDRRIIKCRQLISVRAVQS